MEDQNSPDHLSSSLTDLMTSLMVIFILLLLVFVHGTAGKDVAVTDALLKELLREFKPRGFSENTIRPDPRDPTAILVIVPNRLMNFEASKWTLQPDGSSFLREYVPHFAEVLCSQPFRASIESIVVEGHTDSHHWPGISSEDSQNKNLELSQQRSMEVVKSALADLAGREPERSCFLEKLSATGRGEQDQEPTADESRRVIFKIRVKAREDRNLKEAIK